VNESNRSQSTAGSARMAWCGILAAAMAVNGWYGVTAAAAAEANRRIENLPAACIRRAIYGARAGEPYLQALGRAPTPLAFVGAAPRQVVPNADGTALALLDHGVAVVHWVLNTDAAAYYFVGPVQPTAVGYSEDYSILAVGMSNRLIWTLDARKGTDLAKLGRVGEDDTLFVRFIGEGRYMAGTRRSVLVGSLREPRTYLYEEEDHSAHFGRFAGGGAWLAAADGENRSICVWNCAEERPKKRVLGGWEPTLNALALTPDGRTVVVGHGNPTGTIQFLDVSSGRVTRTMRLRPGSDDFTRSGPISPPTVGVSSLACSPDGKLLVSGGYDGSVRMWDVATGDEVSEFKGHDRQVTAIGFSADGTTLATADKQGNILVWDPRLRVRGGQMQLIDLTGKELEIGWEAMRTTRDHITAYRAIWRFVAGARQSVPFLKNELRPLPGDDPKRIADLLENLGSDRFTLRESASRELAKLADLAESQLRRLLDGKPNQEAKQRAERLLADMERSPTVQRLRWGIAVLRVSKHPDSGEVLKSLVRQYPGTWLAQEADTALRLMAP
jgi:hypothetical protein